MKISHKKLKIELSTNFGMTGTNELTNSYKLSIIVNPSELTTEITLISDLTKTSNPYTQLLRSLITLSNYMSSLQ